MNFEITALQKDEIDGFNRAIFEAFSSSGSALTKAMYPGGFSDHVQTYLHEKTERGLADETTHMIIVRDKDTKAIMACAAWAFQTSDKSPEALLSQEEEARKKRSEQKPVPGVNFDAMNEWREIQAKHTREILQGKAHVRLASLATAPAAQRRGAGSAAVAWGVRKADEMRLPAYLESTPAGHALYVKFGFRDVVEAGFDARVYGSDHRDEYWCMLRDAFGG